MILGTVVAALCVLQPGPLGAQGGLLGARAALRQLPGNSLVIDIDAFRAESEQLSVQAAADGWLKLVAAWDAARSEQSFYADPRYAGVQSLTALVNALPRPETWPLLQSELAKRPATNQNLILAMLFDLLLGDDREVIRKCASLRDGHNPLYPRGIPIQNDNLADFELPVALRLGDGALVQRILVEGAHSTFFYIGIPDLVGLLGEEKATPILQALLLNATRPFIQIEGRETRRLARSLTLANLGKISTPQWGLADGPDCLDFVLALVGRFGTDLLDQTLVTNTANILYANHLLATRHLDEAIRFFSGKRSVYYGGPLPNLGPEQWKEVFSGLSELLVRDPALDMWDTYVDMAAKLTRNSEAARRLDDALKPAALDGTVRRRMLGARAKLAAMSGKEKASIELLIQALQLPLVKGAYDGVRTRLLRLAVVTGSRAAVDAVIASQATFDNDLADQIFGALVTQGRLQDAQKFELGLGSAPDHSTGMRQGTDSAVRLAILYHMANQPNDLAQLIDLYPHWRAPDLAQLLWLFPMHYWPLHDRPLGFLAAWAFANTGRKELAIRTLHAVLRADWTQDNSYRMLNELEGAPAIAFYDELAAINPLEPWPLIWKADLLRRLGRLGEAEHLARAAAAFEASQGGLIPYHYLTSYAVLAEVLRAKGNVSEAKTYESLVRALHLVVKGDGFRLVELLPQALEHYREADQAFANLTCVQVRIASVLAGQGKANEAQDHYRRAYEGVPTRFGRIEPPQGWGNEVDNVEIARPIFERLAKESPTKERMHVVLGRLYRQIGETEKALASFRAAVRLNPRDLDAWLQILELADGGGVPADLANDASLAVVRLGPNVYSGIRSPTRHLRDYAALYRMRAAKPAWWPPTGPLYPLKPPPNNSPPQSMPWALPGAGLASVQAIAHISRLYDLARVRR